jgi:uncharacterized protein HemY
MFSHSRIKLTVNRHTFFSITITLVTLLFSLSAEFETSIKNGGEKLALVHKYLGGVYWRNSRYRQAADELEKYVTLEPKAPDAKKNSRHDQTATQPKLNIDRLTDAV